jgi:hypothetical protein
MFVSAVHALDYGRINLGAKPIFALYKQSFVNFWRFSMARDSWESERKHGTLALTLVTRNILHLDVGHMPRCDLCRRVLLPESLATR